MKKVSILLLLIGACFITSGCVTEAKLDTDKKKQSYAVGYFTGKDLAKQSVSFDIKMIQEGIKDAFKDKPAIAKEDLVDAQQALIATIRENYQKEMESLSLKNAEEGKAFLADNKSKKGVKTTKSGLQYKVITQGKGNKPSTSDKVSVHYRGTLLNGEEFDSSYKRKQPAEFGVTQVIAGWTEALQLMQEGSKYELYIPSDLAYGSRGTQGAIGPNQTLIFEVELLKIVK